MLNILGWQSNKQCIHFNTMVLIYKIKKEMVPGYMTDKLHYRHNKRYELQKAMLSSYSLQSRDPEVRFWIAASSQRT
jgi:hypothetical protein